MKGIAVVFLVSAYTLCSCGSDDKSLNPSQGLTPETIKGTWLATREERLSDHWSQSDENGITTEWKISNPLGSGFGIQAIKFIGDGTFAWNVTNPEEWEQSKAMRDNLPREMWRTYLLAKDKALVTLYTPFEYVGIVAVDTAEFRIALDSPNHMTLQNDEVQLEFTNTMQY